MSQRDRLQTAIQRVLTERSANGIFDGTVLLTQNGETILDRTFGASHEPTEAYRIGCVTKLFTAAALLRLNELSRLDLLAPVTEYVRDLPTLGRERGGVTPTLQHALRCEAGYASFRSSTEFRAALWQRAITEQDLFAFLAKNELTYVPGTSFRYSTTSYHVLGLVIERVMGKPFDEAVDELLLQPLGLQHTGADPSRLVDVGIVDGQTPRPDGGLTSSAGLYRGDPQASSLWGSGCFYSTTENLAKFLDGLAFGRLLQPASLTAMLTPNRHKYGYGVVTWTSSLSGSTYHWHNGGIAGYSSLVLWDAVRRTSLIILQNLDPTIADSGLTRKIIEAFDSSCSEKSLEAG